MVRANQVLSISALFPLLICAQNGSSLSGRVTNSVTGAGIQGVRIRVCPAASSATPQCGTTNYVATTDLAGAFRIDGMPDGSYAIAEFGPKAGFIANQTRQTRPIVTI